MATVVVDEQGSHIQYKTNQLIITSKDDNLSWSIPKMNIERLLIVGRTTLAQSAMDFLLDASIPTHFATTSGCYKGQLCGMEGKNVFARMKQYERYANPAYRNGLARVIVRQKVNNLRYFLAKHNRYHENRVIEDAIVQIKATLQGLDKATNTDEIRGIEGACAATYFQAFGSIFEDREFQFRKRSRRPPLDPINAMLSLGYTVLLAEVITALQSTGLDAYVGYLHSAEYGRPSLACDLQEEFRFVVDELVVKLVNLKQVKAESFEYQEDGAVILTEPAREVFYRAFERKIRGGTIYDGKRHSYRRIIQQQAQKLSKSLFESEPSYQPFVRPQN
ncbi:CRISPR-associated protein Cas1 [Desulfurispirillum indicum S5]|uniref:CRISPR-associated endonuclease Cas1 n=1 Tax=Desulfurispirillum indicum (strain ATCC BAA-1389 / DSM 22839 / S5) TaxID=653733 RepID=E6W3I4_DESIS|nr:CRISPR-associated endonuclease Cas1 [Desulfurispirillum indicum]ADU65777.1 CRISPR-associated protein Cas1 [Desulfurispirillum indicum S5]